MTDLREPLDDLLTDLVVDVPAYVVPDARAAWAAGVRRRVVRRLGAVAAVVALVALTAGLLDVLPRSSDVPPADGERGSGVDGYPSRIEKPWLLRDLPDRPGPLAATVELDDGRFLAVSARSDVWELPQTERVRDFFPSLSADGRMIGYLRDGGTYVLRDLVTGQKTAFDDVGDNRDDPERAETWWTQQQVPGYWSPDGSTHLLSASRWDDARSNHVLLLGIDGSLRQVGQPAVVAYPLGWLDDEVLGWLVVDGKRRDMAASLVVTDESGEELRREPLDIAAHLLSDVDQWSGSLSPSGERLSVTLSDGTSTTVVSTFATIDGALIDRARSTLNVHDVCSTSWAEDRVVLPLLDDRDVRLVLTSGSTVLTVDPRLGAYCVMTAGDALGGDRHRAVGDLFGTTWLSWHWREVSLGLVAGLLAVGLVRLAIRRRVRRLATRQA